MDLFFLIIVSLTGLVVLGNILTYSFQYHFIFRPQKLSKDFKFNFDHPFKEIFLKTKGQGRINALWFRDEKAKSKKGLIVYFHGNTENLSNWGKVFAEFVAFGYDMLIPDYRGFGKSRGLKGEEYFYSDAKAIYDLARENYSLGNIIIYGRSMGSGPATWLAANAECKRLVLEVPFSSMPDLFYCYYPFLPKFFFFRYQFPNTYNLRKVKCPVTVFAGTRDKVVPFRCARKLKPFLKTSDEFHAIVGGKHNDLFQHQKCREELRQILED